jgi:hypothetical protein
MLSEPCCLSCRGLHRTYGAHHLHDHLSKRGMEESGDEGDRLRLLNPPQRDSRTISQEEERRPHFLAVLLSRFPAFLLSCVTSLGPYSKTLALSSLTTTMRSLLGARLCL